MGESYGIASDKNETNSAHKSDCTSHLGLGLYHRERTKETDERICLGDEDEGDNEAGNDDVSAGEGGNEVGRGENVNENSNKVNDNNSNDEIEEENKRGQQHRSECCTNDHACKPISLGDNPHLLTISEGAAGQHEVQTRDCLRGMKLILLGPRVRNVNVIQVQRRETREERMIIKGPKH